MNTWERILAAHQMLEPDAREVLAVIAERLVKGRKIYGDLVLKNDERDMIQETLEEVADGLVYAGCALVKAKRG